MTEVYVAGCGDLYLVTACGHAEGCPEVCAAISALLTALAGYLQNDKEIETLECELAPGCGYLEFRGGERARAVYDLTVIGLLQLAEAKPKYLRVVG